MGSKVQRQNQHKKHLERKIRQYEKAGKNTEKLQKEMSYATGAAARPEFKTGREADARVKRYS